MPRDALCAVPCVGDQSHMGGSFNGQTLRITYPRCEAVLNMFHDGRRPRANHEENRHFNFAEFREAAGDIIRHPRLNATGLGDALFEIGLL